MKYRRLGNTGLRVSQICLGTNNFGGQLDEENSIKIIRKAIDCGINLIDTANTYTNGNSEKLIGRAVRDNRDDLIIATKVGFEIGEGPNQGGLSRKHVLWQIKQSLQRLGTDFIDIYYLHRFDAETRLEDTLRTMDSLIQDGTVRYVACSNFSALQIVKSHCICEKLGFEKFIAVQPPYNLLQRGIESELLPYCEEEGLGVLTYTPLMGGFLAGKYAKNAAPPTGSRGKFNSRFWDRVNKESNFAKLEAIKRIADDAGVPVSHLAMSWIIKNPRVTAPIVGASSPEQVEENCTVAEFEVSEETCRRLNEATRTL